MSVVVRTGAGPVSVGVLADNAVGLCPGVRVRVCELGVLDAGDAEAVVAGQQHKVAGEGVATITCLGVLLILHWL